MIVDREAARAARRIRRTHPTQSNQGLMVYVSLLDKNRTESFGSKSVVQRVLIGTKPTHPPTHSRHLAGSPVAHSHATQPVQPQRKQRPAWWWPNFRARYQVWKFVRALLAPSFGDRVFPLDARRVPLLSEIEMLRASHAFSVYSFSLLFCSMISFRNGDKLCAWSV